MTKPTVTQSITQYGLFRKGVEFHTLEYTLQNTSYNTLAEATAAQRELLAALPLPERASIEIRLVEDAPAYREEFGTNPLAWMS